LKLWLHNIRMSCLELYILITQKNTSIVYRYVILTVYRDILYGGTMISFLFVFLKVVVLVEWSVVF
jgi:hypothetical protein